MAATIHKTAEGINIKQQESYRSSEKFAFLAYARWRHPAYHRAAREIQGWLGTLLTRPALSQFISPFVIAIPRKTLSFL